MAILWGPFTYIETDTTILTGGHTVKSIPIDFTGFPTGVGALTLVVLAGQVQYDSGNFGDVDVVLGGVPELYAGGQLIWDGFFAANPTTWSDWPTILIGSPTTPFTSPGPGVTNLNFQANAGESAPTPAGFRNFTIEIIGNPVGPSISSVNVHDNRTVNVIFSAAVDPITASNPANYSIDHGLVVTKSVRVSDLWYRLTTTRQTNDVVYTVTSSGIGPLS